MRRTWRLRPSWITNRNTAPSGVVLTNSTLAGLSAAPSSSIGARSTASAAAASPRTPTRYVFFHLVLRVHQLMRKLAVVRHEQQPRRIEVEPAHRYTRAPTSAVRSRTVRRPRSSAIVETYPHGLVQHDIKRFLPEKSTGLPSSNTVSASGSAPSPSRATSPLTVTRPTLMYVSAAAAEQIPPRPIIFAISASMFYLRFIHKSAQRFQPSRRARKYPRCPRALRAAVRCIRRTANSAEPPRSILMASATS